MTQERIVAVGLLTQGDLDRLGSGFRNVIPVKHDAVFDDLLAQLDQITAEPIDWAERPNPQLATE